MSDRNITKIPSTGRWGLSRIVTPRPNYFVPQAALDLLGRNRVQAFYCPFDVAGRRYAVEYALVRIVGPIAEIPRDTVLFPDISQESSLGSLDASVRLQLGQDLKEILHEYSFVDRDEPRTISIFNDSELLPATKLRDVILKVFDHFAHTEHRDLPNKTEEHNTEYTDGFDSDPSGRWTALGTSSWVYDSTDHEMDIHTTSDEPYAFRYNTGPGSIEHEAQVTQRMGPTEYERRLGGNGVRMPSDATTGYCVSPFLVGGDPYYELDRVVAEVGTYLDILTGPIGWTYDEFVTCRLAAEGTLGNNVILSFWGEVHGTSAKPSDPGWIGDDESPDDTYTDTDASRLDDSTNSMCGIMGWPWDADNYWDTKTDYWKGRAISDRGGGAGLSIPVAMDYYRQRRN